MIPRQILSQALVPCSFTIFGAPRTKKNHGRMLMRGKRVFHVPSEAHQNWSERAMVELVPVRNRGTIQDPVNCRALFYRERNVGDAVGYYQALADALEDARVIHDDYLIVSWDGSRLLKDAANPRIEVTLEVL